MAKKDLMKNTAVKRGLAKDETGEYKEDLKDSIQKESFSASHTCVSCGRTRPDSKFYINKTNSADNFRDTWCKDCVIKKVRTKEDLKKYMEENFRVFDEKIWEKCVVDAVRQTGIFDEEDEELVNAASRLYATMGHQPRYRAPDREEAEEDDPPSYDFVPEERGSSVILDNDAIFEFEEDAYEDYPQTDSDIVDFLESEEKTFSEYWNGYYTARELKFLEDTFREYNAQFELSDINMVQSAKATIKATLGYDNAIARYNLDPSTENRMAVEKFSRIMIEQSGSGKFSAKARTPNDFNNFSDLGSLIKAIEETGALIRKQEFDKDDVDFLREEIIRGNVQSMRDEKFGYEDDDDGIL